MIILFQVYNIYNENKLFLFSFICFINPLTADIKERKMLYRRSSSYLFSSQFYRFTQDNAKSSVRYGNLWNSPWYTVQHRIRYIDSAYHFVPSQVVQYCCKHNIFFGESGCFHLEELTQKIPNSKLNYS